MGMRVGGKGTCVGGVAIVSGCLCLLSGWADDPTLLLYLYTCAVCSAVVSGVRLV